MPSTVLDLLACLVAAASLGAMSFFSAVVAPNVFRTIPAADAGAFLRALFPHYFVLNGIAALVAAALTREVVPAAVFAGGGIAMLLVRLLLIPRINAARDSMRPGDTKAAAAFHRLHGLSVAVNLLEMAGVALAIVLIAQR